MIESVARQGWVAIAILALPGCPAPPASGPDAGPTRDAMVVDSTITNDASSDVGAREDSGSAIDGGQRRCGGACDPTADGACGGTLACRFSAGVPVCTTHDADAGAATDGQPCTYEADCAAGTTCFGPAGHGTCGRVCCEAGDCDLGERCRGDGMLADGSLTAWGRCMPPAACDLAHPENACAAREGCYIVDETGATECLIAGTVPGGAACQGAADCVPGHVCAGLSARTCVAICFLASTAPHQGCGDTEHCEAQAYSPAGTGICTAS